MGRVLAFSRVLFSLSLFVGFTVPVLTTVSGCAVNKETGKIGLSEKGREFFTGTKITADSVSATTPAGTGIHEIAVLIGAVAGAIVAVDTSIKGVPAVANTVRRKKPAKPVASETGA